MCFLWYSGFYDSIEIIDRQNASFEISKLYKFSSQKFKEKKKEEVHPIHFKVIVEEWMSISYEGQSPSINQRVQSRNNIRIKTSVWNEFINTVY